MRHILGLLPSEKQQKAFIQEAHEVFAPINDGYLLTDGISLPHVTLCSFRCGEEQTLAKITTDVQSWKTKRCDIRLIGLMLKKGKVPPHHYSVSLAVAREASLIQMHYLGFKLLSAYEIKPLNPSQDLYFPHLTLAGISWSPPASVSLPSSIDDLLSLSLEPFHLVLGRGDDIGQYLETLLKF